MTIITEQFYILILDMDDNLIHKESVGDLFPSMNTVERIIRQVADSYKSYPTDYTGKIDKRIRIVETK